MTLVNGLSGIDDMKVMVIGAGGQLGSDVCKELGAFELVPLLHADIEITDMASVKAAFQKHRPDVVINTAAYHQPDQCEDNPDKAFRVNALGPRNLAVAAQESGAKLVHLSSDYVFGGEEGRTVPYTEFDAPSPINVVGRAKLAGESLIQHLCPRYFIVRVSGVFGRLGRSGKGPNFVETMLKLGRERSELRVVNDQVFSPTCAPEAAGKIARLIPTDSYGIFHITNQGQCSWYEFSVEILRLAGIRTPVIPIPSSQYPQKARRPKFSVLDNYHLRLLGMADARTWQEALKAYMKEKGHLSQS